MSASLTERSDVATATRDTLRRLARLERLCRSCGAHTPAGQTVYVVGSLDDPNNLRHWRMCGSCWRAGYDSGETPPEEYAR